MQSNDLRFHLFYFQVTTVYGTATLVENLSIEGSSHQLKFLKNVICNERVIDHEWASILKRMNENLTICSGEVLNQNYLVYNDDF